MNPFPVGGQTGRKKENMNRKMRRYAMLYIAEQAEETFPDDETMTPERFMELTGTEFVYEEVCRGSRIDAILTIVHPGEGEALFKFNIAR